MKHVEALIPSYVSGDLDPDRAAIVERHLEVCPGCGQALAEARSLWDLLGTAQADRPADGSIWPAVRSRTLGRTEKDREWFFGNGPWTRTGLASAALAAGLMLGVLLPASQGTSPEAEVPSTESSWLMESTWLSSSSWLNAEGSLGLDEILLGADLADEGNGS